jgi:hypothetical protein
MGDAELEEVFETPDLYLPYTENEDRSDELVSRNCNSNREHAAQVRMVPIKRSKEGKH